MEELIWGTSKLVEVAYGIQKLQIKMKIQEELVSVENIIKEKLLAEPNNEYIQSWDIHIPTHLQSNKHQMFSP